jgi:nucleotide-binding universal stress UspA family protein
MKALLLSLSLILSALPLAAQSGAAARVASELVESLAKRGSSAAAAKSSAELAQLGGTKAVQEILEAAQREGGDALMRRIVSTAEQHGVVALSALHDWKLTYHETPGPISFRGFNGEDITV